MAGSVNKAIVVGRLGADPEIHQGKDGPRLSSPEGDSAKKKTFATFNVATGESWRNKQSGEREERTEWHRVVVFHEKLAEIAAQYLRKGSLVYITGKMQTRRYEDRSGQERRVTEIVLRGFDCELTMLEAKGDQRPPPPSGEGDYAPPLSSEAGRQDEKSSSSGAGAAGGSGFSEDDYRKASGG